MDAYIENLDNENKERKERIKHKFMSSGDECVEKSSILKVKELFQIDEENEGDISNNHDNMNQCGAESNELNGKLLPRQKKKNMVPSITPTKRHKPMSLSNNFSSTKPNGSKVYRKNRGDITKVHRKRLTLIKVGREI